jgi:peptidoglycan/xylan/chitin deacetylase (PgdA/CDA1 family)
MRGVLHMLRGLGLFRLAQFLTRRRLRILAYHGFAFGDQHEFEPFLFMRESTFRRRLEILRKRRLSVIPLDTAVRRRDGGANGAVEAVITIDDGWSSTLGVAAPLLERFGYPATLYLSTRHAVEGTPVAPVVLGYMFWKRNETPLVLQGVHPSVDGSYEFTSHDHARQGVLEEKIARLDSAAQARMLQQVADRFGFDMSSLTADRRFQFIAMDDIGTLAKMGVDTQLHTHDHFLPDGVGEFREQLERNRNLIRMHKPGEPPRHFCYPSGRYSDKHAQWLAELDILSATTCDSGMNRAGENPYLLRRFLDSDNISEIEFEAQLSGVFEIAGLLRALVGRYFGS